VLLHFREAHHGYDTFGAFCQLARATREQQYRAYLHKLYTITSYNCTVLKLTALAGISNLKSVITQLVKKADKLQQDRKSLTAEVYIKDLKTANEAAIAQLQGTTRTSPAPGAGLTSEQLALEHISDHLARVYLRPLTVCKAESLEPILQVWLRTDYQDSHPWGVHMH
jgi:hypothetical protein